MFKNDFFSLEDRLAFDMLQDGIKNLSEGKIPERFIDMENKWNLSMMELRSDYNRKFAFSLIAKDWIKILSKCFEGHKVLEIFAGNGLLAKALSDEGTDIICTDNYEWEDDDVGYYKSWKTHWFDVEKIDYLDAIEKYGKDVSFMIMSWPEYENPKAYNALLRMEEINPSCKIIYIGELEGGCTADDLFFESIEYIDDEYVKTANVFYPRFPGIHDRIYMVKFNGKIKESEEN